MNWPNTHNCPVWDNSCELSADIIYMTESQLLESSSVATEEAQVESWKLEWNQDLKPGISVWDVDILPAMPNAHSLSAAIKWTEICVEN